MSGISYSLDQIEKKRQLALQRRAEREAQNNKPGLNNKLLANGSGHKAQQTAQQNFGTTWSSQTPSTSKTKSTKQDYRASPLKAKNIFQTCKVLKGACSMVDETRFVVNVDYHQKLIEVFKTIPSRLYDIKSKKWSFHINDYEKLIVECMQFRPQVIIAPIPSYVVQVLRGKLDKKTETEVPDLSSIDRKLTESLMPFQREGICFGISKKGRCFIADDMGLGKTIQALGLAHYYRENWPLLIVTPSSVRYQWSEAIFNFLPSVPTQCVHQFSSGKDYVGRGQITIVSYDLLVRSVELFERHRFGFVILDESHSVKSGKAARTKAVQRIVSQAQRVILLSGTPALSRPMELYSQINLVVPSFMSYHDYGLRYCAAKSKSFGWDYSGSSNMEELQVLLKATCLIRRLKTDVLKQLLPKFREVVMLDPELIKEGSRECKEIAKKLNNTVLNKMEKHNAILEYYHESSDQRIKAVCNYVSDFLEREQKFLIYAHHRNVLRAITDCLVAKGIRYIFIDGNTTPEQRKTQVDLFQESDEILVAVLSITAANAGITLTAAQLVVFAELFWNPGILCQAEDRVHRIGQAHSVVILYLVAKGTADDYMWPLIQKKMNILSKVGLDQDFCLNEAEVSEQKVHVQLPTTPRSIQRTLDSFVTVSPSQSNSAKSQTPPEANDTQTAETFDFDLDGLDDVNFDGIDLANVV